MLKFNIKSFIIVQTEDKMWRITHPNIPNMYVGPFKKKSHAKDRIKENLEYWIATDFYQFR